MALMNHNSLEKWHKDEIASAFLDNELGAAARSGPPRVPPRVRRRYGAT